MDLNEFMECCSFDFFEENGKTQVLVIFSEGFIKEYSSQFANDNQEVAKKLVASDLLGNIREQFNG